MWLSLGILALLLAGGCREHVSAVHPASPPAVHKPRVDVPRDGETLLKPPVRAARPRGPAYRLDNGLGSPIT